MLPLWCLWIFLYNTKINLILKLKKRVVETEGIQIKQKVCHLISEIKIWEKKITADRKKWNNEKRMYEIHSLLSLLKKWDVSSK